MEIGTRPGWIKDTFRNSLPKSTANNAASDAHSCSSIKTSHVALQLHPDRQEAPGFVRVRMVGRRQRQKGPPKVEHERQQKEIEIS